MNKDEIIHKKSFWLSNSTNYFRGYSTKKVDETEEFDKFTDKFYENENVLKHDNEVGEVQNAFCEKDFKELVKKEVLNFVNQSFDNIVVLIGAGASVTDNRFKKDDNGINISGATVAKIAEEVNTQLLEKKYKLGGSEESTDVFTLDEVINKIKYSYKLDDTEFNLEDVISLMISYEKFIGQDKKKFLNTKDAIFDIIIKATSYDYNNELFKHVRFLKILSSLVKENHKLNLITTNYDTLIEDAADRMDFTVIDGFSFSQTPKFNSNMFDWNIVKSVPNIKTNQNIYMNNVVNLLKIHGSLTWEWSEHEEKILRKNKKAVRKPIMVFPSSDKYAQSYQEPYFDLFSKFQELLKQPNTLFITTGFSFADNHISKMIISAIKSNDGLATLVTDYDIDSSNGNWQKVVEKMNESYRVAFLKATLNYDLTDFLGGTIDAN